jgi:UDP-glucose 4-epimerase
MDSEKLTCTVLGANGYIGRHLVHFLDKRGFTIFAYGQNEVPHPNLPSKVSYSKFDITQAESIDSVRFNVDFVFVFSGKTGTKVSFDQYQHFTEVNEIGLLHVLNRISKLDKKPHIVFPSSRLVYKGSEFPLKEDAEKEAKTIYAANKLNCERFLETYKQQFNIPYTIFRICVPYGNLFDDNFSYGTIGFFLSQAKQGQTITLFGDGNLKRTFTHIESLCFQMIEVLLHGKNHDSVYNIGGETFSLKTVAMNISQSYNVPVNFVPWPKEDLQLESGHTVFDSLKIEHFKVNNQSFDLTSWINKQ